MVVIFSFESQLSVELDDELMKYTFTRFTGRSIDLTAESMHPAKTVIGSEINAVFIFTRGFSYEVENHVHLAILKKIDFHRNNIDDLQPG